MHVIHTALTHIIYGNSPRFLFILRILLDYSALNHVIFHLRRCSLATYDRAWIINNTLYIISVISWMQLCRIILTIKANKMHHFATLFW
jgi:hypothetical protein